MNGFVIFDRQDAVDRFLQALKSQMKLQSPDQIVRSQRMACVTYRDLTSEEVSSMSELAERHGGQVQESTKYVPAAG